jgi:hypothetical protein
LPRGVAAFFFALIIALPFIIPFQYIFAQKIGSFIRSSVNGRRSFIYPKSKRKTIASIVEIYTRETNFSKVCVVT